MIKKTFLSLILLCLIFACGKKGDPEYKKTKINPKIQSLLINKS